MELILASASPRRAELMRMCGYDFTVIPSAADEGKPAADDPAGIVMHLSVLKAAKVMESLPPERRRNAVVIGSDTVVVVDGRILGKPRTREEAIEMLRTESGRWNHVYTGVAVLRMLVEDAGERCVGKADFDTAGVRFAAMTDEEIEAYVATGEPMDKAGAYGIQGRSSMFIDRIEGSFYTVVGLPVHLLYRMLKDVGIEAF